MDSYNQTSDSNHALDFTKSSKRELEPPILDLSCKKDESQSLSYSLSPPSSEARSLSPLHDPPASDHQHQLPFSDEQKSPYGGRTFMVTPPSDPDSPKKSKFGPMFPQIAPISSDITHRYPLMPMTLPVPMAVAPAIAPVMPPLLANQTGGTVKQIQVPVSTSNIPIMNHEVPAPLVSPDASKKAPRPFKAYPKDPLALTMGPEIIYDQNSNEAYTEFRKRMLDSVRRTNEGTNIKMRRVSQSPVLPTSTMGVLDDKDAAYWERRRKNNEAAKRSRDARRAKEDEIAIRAAFLEQENMKLKYELVALRNETAKLRCMVYSN